MTDTPVCGECQGRGVKRVESENGPQDVFCSCLPPIKICALQGHELFMYRSKTCPLCAANQEISRLREQLKAYRGAEKSEVQKLNERVTEKTVEKKPE